MVKSRRSVILIAAGAAVLIAVTSASSAVATRMITGADIQNHSITGKDLKAGTISLGHLDRMSIRAGHAHHSREAFVVGRGASKSKVTRDSNSSVRLNNFAMTRIAAVTSLPVGTYTVVVGGSVQTTVVMDQSKKYYPSSVWCTLNALGTQVAMQGYGSSPNAATNYNPTVAMTRVVTLTSPGDISVACEIASSLSGYNGTAGNALIDLVAFPTTSSSEG